MKAETLHLNEPLVLSGSPFWSLCRESKRATETPDIPSVTAKSLSEVQWQAFNKCLAAYNGSEDSEGSWNYEVDCLIPPVKQPLYVCATNRYSLTVYHCIGRPYQTDQSPDVPSWRLADSIDSLECRGKNSQGVLSLQDIAMNTLLFDYLTAEGPEMIDSVEREWEGGVVNDNTMTEVGEKIGRGLVSSMVQHFKENTPFDIEFHLFNLDEYKTLGNQKPPQISMYDYRARQIAQIDSRPDNVLCSNAGRYERHAIVSGDTLNTWAKA
ncbi:hypothetical protein M231_05730 [Tremella mesenterica]|uniref:Uncharacterized protein n=1 Tax=Tremella mesenterica TaxID=5217 RepID=A0A4Q1BHE8_TREME|nr:hypothetical protein M231_05730 [Tremella mesenterica]